MEVMIVSKLIIYCFTVIFSLNVSSTKCNTDIDYDLYSSNYLDDGPGDWMYSVSEPGGKLLIYNTEVENPFSNIEEVQPSIYTTQVTETPSSVSTTRVTFKPKVVTGKPPSNNKTFTEIHENNGTNILEKMRNGSWYFAFGNTTLLPPVKVAVKCPEVESPLNIGPYEVPTERDLVILALKTLHRMFASYHRKAMLFLEDVREVVMATEEVANKCINFEYEKCVKQVRKKFEVVIKRVTKSLEEQRHDILAFGQNENTICSLQSMKKDPLKLIKILASEDAALDFALPGFLRELNICQFVCKSRTSYKTNAKPSRRALDLNNIIRKFLAKKNYKRLLEPKSKGIHMYKL